MNTTTQVEIVRSLSEKLKAHYVFPEIAEKICLCLKKHLEDGDYSGITEDELFALALTLHLQEVNHDEHLWVRWHAEPLPENDDPLRLDPAWQEEQKLKARLDNFGIHRVERLPGNIGYIDIRYFHRAAWGGATVVAAMNFLANTSALIIDLRKCTGGYPAMVALVASFLFGDEPIHLSNIYWRDEDLTQQYWSLPYVPGERYVGKPVYVLVSNQTFSAAEELASILQTRRRAIIMGEQTDGGAHPGTSYRLHAHFEVFIPIGRGTNPITGEDLEGVGVTPDVAIPQEHAFLAAYHRALKDALASQISSSSVAIKALAQETQSALDNLAPNQIVCPTCGYPNPQFRATCKNCDQTLPVG